jgi:hypothetical protein
MLLNDRQIWWDAPNAVRIPYGIAAALILGPRIYSVYRSSRNTPQRSLRGRRIERIVAISLRSFIALAVILLLAFKR